jgi:hypothetical protein
MVLPLLTSVSAQAADVSGKWPGSSPDNGPMRTVFAVLKQEGTTLNGSAGSAVLAFLENRSASRRP